MRISVVMAKTDVALSHKDEDRRSQIETFCKLSFTPTITQQYQYSVLTIKTCEKNGITPVFSEHLRVFETKMFDILSVN